MGKRVYISADYSENDGDRDVIAVLHAWGNDNLHKVDYVDTAEVVSGSVSSDPNCRACDLKAEFNKQINASSCVIFVIGDKTSKRMAGSSCQRHILGTGCSCTPYKQNINGQTYCKIWGDTHVTSAYEDLGIINGFSYIEHEFKQAERKNKTIIVVYNSLYKQQTWLPTYMSGYEAEAQPFWIRNIHDERIGNYEFVKKALGYD